MNAHDFYRTLDHRTYMHCFLSIVSHYSHKISPDFTHLSPPPVDPVKERLESIVRAKQRYVTLSLPHPSSHVHAATWLMRPKFCPMASQMETVSVARHHVLVNRVELTHQNLLL